MGAAVKFKIFQYMVVQKSDHLPTAIQHQYFICEILSKIFSSLIKKSPARGGT